MAVDCDRWNWRELVASELSGLPPTTRLVLLTISLHMNENGANCWPSQASIVKRTGLSERAVREHLDIAERYQWIRVEQRRRPGKAWFNHQYYPIVPDKLADEIKAAPWEDDPKWERPAPRAARKGSRPANGAEHPAPSSSTPGTTCRDARHHVPTNSSSNSPINNSCERLLTQTAPDVFSQGKKEPEGRRPSPFPDSTPASPATAQHVASLREWVAKQAAEEAQKPKKYSAEDDRQLIEHVRKNIEMGIDDSRIKCQLQFFGSDERIQWAINEVRQAR